MLAEEQAPIWFRVVFGLIGALSVYGGINHLRFLFRRRSALSGGRERKGTVQLRGKLDDHSTTALLTFTTSYGQWLLMLDPKDVEAHKVELRKGMSARATVGEDDRVYGLRLDGKDIDLQSEGTPFKGVMRIAIEKAENWVAEQEVKRPE